MRCVTVFAVFALSCATLATEGEGDRDLPSTGVGPFRKLVPEEQRGTPPVVLDDEKLQFRDPAVLRLSDDPHSTAIRLYVTGIAADGSDVIYRSHATDARSFYGTSSHAGARPVQVLAASHAWEGGNVRAPSMLRVVIPAGDEVWMYYAGDSGIGLARSKDGFAFTSQDTPVLMRPGAHQPSVVRLADGSLRMFYERGGQIWEAESVNGTQFTDRGIVLGPSPAPATLDPGEKPPFDALAVGAPCVSIRTTVAARVQFRVLYTGLGADGLAIGFAARYGMDGPLVRNHAPVYSSPSGDASPALFEWTDPSARTQAISMLYDTQTTRVGYPAIAAAVAPVGAKLGEPAEFPDAP